MTREEAAYILDPETTREALLPYAIDGPMRLAVVEEACRVAVKVLREQEERSKCEWCAKWKSVTCPVCGRRLED